MDDEPELPTWEITKAIADKLPPKDDSKDESKDPRDEDPLLQKDGLRRG